MHDPRSYAIFMNSWHATWESNTRFLREKTHDKQLELIDIKQKMWNDNVHYALGIHRRITRMLGIWPLDGRNWLSVLRNCIVILALIMLNINLAGRWTINGNCGSMTELLDAITIMACSFIVVMQMIFILKHRERYSNIINAAIRDWAAVKDVETTSYGVMHRYADMGRIVALVQMSGAYLSIAPVILINPPRHIEVHDELHNMSIVLRYIPGVPTCWVPTDISTWIYYSFHISTCLALLLGTTGFTGCTVFTFGLAMHLVGQFESLNDNLLDIYGNETDGDVDEKLAKVSKRHSHLLELAEGFHTATNFIVFLVLGVNTFIICVSEVMLLWALKTGDSKTAIDMIIRTSLMYIQIFLYSYIGEKFSVQAGKLQFSLYNCPWYKMPPKIVNNLKFMMMRNNIPLRLTAGKVCVMDFENFKDIVKSMLSYFSILRLIFNVE